MSSRSPGNRSRQSSSYRTLRYRYDDSANSAVHGILSLLQHEGAVLRDLERQVLGLGWRLFKLGQRAQEDMEIRRIARNYISNLNRDLDETVHLTVLDGGEVLCVDCVESTKRLRTYPVIGVRAPLYCTAVGKALMVYMPVRRVDKPGHQVMATADESTADMRVRSGPEKRYQVGLLMKKQIILSLILIAALSTGALFAAGDRASPAMTGIPVSVSTA